VRRDARAAARPAGGGDAQRADAAGAIEAAFEIHGVVLQIGADLDQQRSGEGRYRDEKARRCAFGPGERQAHQHRR
jgi:hypothetical protein